MFSIRIIKFKIFAAIIAGVCLIAGVYLTFFHSRGFVETKAVIVDIEESYNDADNSVTYTPTVEYSVDGTTYTGKLDSSSPSYSVGKTITVLYDPGNPSVVHSGLGFGIYFMIVSAVILAVILISTIREKQSQRQLDEQRAANGQMAYAPSVQGEERELYFLTDTGTAKYGHRIEDRSRKVLYEAKMTKFSVTTPFSFDFIDHEHGTTTPHLVGHQEANKGRSLLLDQHYTFELDGEEIWKHLKRHGITVDTERMEGAIWPRYRVCRDGEEIAVLETSGPYVHEEDAEQHSVANKVAVPGYYRVWTREETLDAVFMAAFAFARSGALNDEGGTFGKMIRQEIAKDFGKR